MTDHLYHLIGEPLNDREEIEWNYDNSASAAYRAWRHVKATGETPDTGERLKAAAFYRDGKLRETWRASAEIVPLRREG